MLAALLHHVLLLLPVLLGLVSEPVMEQPISAFGSEDTAKSKKEVDPYGRESSEGTVTGFIDALAADNLERASVYLDLRSQRKAARAQRGEALAVQARELLDRGGSLLPRASLSNAASGKLDDGLEPEL